MAIDPVCGMNVEEDTAKWRSLFKGQEYLFCSKKCKDIFDRDPEKTLSSPYFCPVEAEKKN